MKKQKKLHKTFYKTHGTHSTYRMAISAFGILFCAHAYAEESLKVFSDSEERRAQIIFSPDYISLTKGKSKISGVGLGTSLVYGLDPHWGIGAELKQVFTAGSNLSALFTDIGLSAEYSFSGSLIQKNNTLLLGDKEVYRSHTSSVGGFFLQFNANQYFFNSPKSVLPFTGLGTALSYDFASESAFHYGLGVRVDRLSNADSTLYPLQFFANLGFWL